MPLHISGQVPFAWVQVLVHCVALRSTRAFCPALLVSVYVPWLLFDEVVPFSEQETRLGLCDFCEPVKCFKCWPNDSLVVCEKCLFFFWTFTCSVKLLGGTVVIILLCPLSQLPPPVPQMPQVFPLSLHCWSFPWIGPSLWPLKQSKVLALLYLSFRVTGIWADLVVWIELVTVFNFTKVIKYLWSLALLILMPSWLLFLWSVLFELSWALFHIKIKTLIMQWEKQILCLIEFKGWEGPQE